MFNEMEEEMDRLMNMNQTEFEKEFSMFDEAEPKEMSHKKPTQHAEEDEDDQDKKDRELLIRTFFPKIWREMQDGAKEAVPKKDDKHHKGFGVCPVLAFLIIIKLFHLYTLHSLKTCYRQIRLYKKAKEAVKAKTLIRTVQTINDEERFSTSSIVTVTKTIPANVTTLNTSAETESDLIDKAGADDERPTFSYEFVEPSTLPRYGEPLIH